MELLGGFKDELSEKHGSRNFLRKQFPNSVVLGTFMRILEEQLLNSMILETFRRIGSRNFSNYLKTRFLSSTVQGTFRKILREQFYYFVLNNMALGPFQWCLGGRFPNRTVLGSFKKLFRTFLNSMILGTFRRISAEQYAKPYGSRDFQEDFR